MVIGVLLGLLYERAGNDGSKTLSNLSFLLVSVVYLCYTSLMPAVLKNHPSCVAFITHAGLLSLTEAVEAGVPMVMVPVLGDQPGNAAHAQRAGIAEVIPLYDLDEHTLYEALLKVLTPEMRARAKKFSQVWSERPLSPMDTAIYHIEYTARHGGFNSLSRRHNYNTQLFVIKYGTLIVILTVIFVIASCCCRTKKVKVKLS